MKKTINEIEEMRDGLTEFIVQGIDHYEKESGMYVESIMIKEDGTLVILDRINCTS